MPRLHHHRFVSMQLLSTIIWGSIICLFCCCMPKTPCWKCKRSKSNFMCVWLYIPTLNLFYIFWDLCAGLVYCGMLFIHIRSECLGLVNITATSFQTFTQVLWKQSKYIWKKLWQQFYQVIKLFANEVILINWNSLYKFIIMPLQMKPKLLSNTHYVPTIIYMLQTTYTCVVAKTVYILKYYFCMTKKD